MLGRYSRRGCWCPDCGDSFNIRRRKRVENRAWRRWEREYA